MRAGIPQPSPLEPTGRGGRMRSVGAVLLTGALIWQLALYAEEPPFTRNQVSTLEARVDSVDVSSGRLVLRNPSGGKWVYTLGKDVKNLDRVRTGDRIVLYSYMGVAAELKPAGEPMTRRTEITNSDGKTYLLPQGTVRRTTTLTVEFESLDPDARTVTFKSPDGITRTATLRDDRGLEFAKRLKVGDRLSVTYVESTAFKITSR